METLRTDHYALEDELIVSQAIASGYKYAAAVSAPRLKRTWEHSKRGAEMVEAYDRARLFTLAARL